MTMPFESLMKAAHEQALSALCCSQPEQGFMMLQLWIFFSSFHVNAHVMHMCRSCVPMDATKSRVVFLQQRLESQAEFFPSPFELLGGKEKRWFLGFIVDLEAHCLSLSLESL